MSALEDKEAIRELFSDYCFRLDDERYAELAQLFTEDGEWIANYSHARGRDEIVAMLTRNVPPKASGLVRKHAVLNSLIRLDEDRATARATYLVLIGRKGQRPEPVVIGTYEDELVRTDAGWRLRSRRLVHDIAGDLGLNLR